MNYYMQQVLWIFDHHKHCKHLEQNKIKLQQALQHLAVANDTKT